MKAFFEGIAWLFEEILFLPYNILRELEQTSWLLANSVNWIFLIIGFSALIYWVLQLNLFDKNGEEDKDPSAHSFLYIESYIFSIVHSLKADFFYGKIRPFHRSFKIFSKRSSCQNTPSICDDF